MSLCFNFHTRKLSFIPLLIPFLLLPLFHYPTHISLIVTTESRILFIYRLETHFIDLLVAI